MTDSTSNVSTPASTSTTEAVQPTSASTTGEVQSQESTPESVVEEMFKLKVLGEEKEYPKSEVLKLAQQGLGANRKFEEVARARKELEAIAKNLVENPRDFLRNHPNREAIIQASQELLSEYVEEQEKLNSMSDSEKRAVELQKELEKREKELNERDNQIKRQLQEHYRKQFQSEILQALDKTDLPLDESSIVRVANLYKQAINNGIQTSFEQCAKIVERDYLKYIDAINKKREKLHVQKQKTKSIQSSPVKKEKKKIAWDDFQNELKEMAKL